jgi:hypothetical protein
LRGIGFNCSVTSLPDADAYHGRCPDKELKDQVEDNVDEKNLRTERRLSMLLLIIVLVLLFGGGGGYYGYSRWGHAEAWG